MARQQHKVFIQVKIHTAKCDICNRNNKATLYRCELCGFQICTPCKHSDAGDGVHMMNAGEGGRPRKWSRSSSPTLPAAVPNPISPELGGSPEIKYDAQLETVPNLPSQRRKRKRQIIEESDDESDEYITQNARNEQRLRRRVNGDRANKRLRSTESIRLPRLTRAVANASSDIKETADYLLALGSSSPHTTTLRADENENHRDEVGLMLLAEAAGALTGDPYTETTQGHNAQVHSPLFFAEEIDLVTLRGSEVVSERETSMDDTMTLRAARRDLPRMPQINPGECLQVVDGREAPGVITFRLPPDTEVTYVPRDAAVSQRLRDLYQSALVVKRPKGGMRPLCRREQDRQ